MSKCENILDTDDGFPVIGILFLGVPIFWCE